MFDFNLVDLKDKIVDSAMKQYEESIKSINKTTPDVYFEFTEKTTTLIFSVMYQLIEENNKAIWNDLVSRGIVKE